MALEDYHYGLSYEDLGTKGFRCMTKRVCYHVLGYIYTIMYSFTVRLSPRGVWTKVRDSRLLYLREMRGLPVHCAEFVFACPIYLISLP